MGRFRLFEPLSGRKGALFLISSDIERGTMQHKHNLSIDLKIEEFARELGLQLRLILPEKKSEDQEDHNEMVKPVVKCQPSEDKKAKS
jgi:hypothetical protein